MTKSNRGIDGATSSEIGELREMMQKVLTEVGTPAGEVSTLKGLDQAVVEIREKLASTGENQRGKSPAIVREREGLNDGPRQFDERSQREKSIGSYNNHHFQFSRWSRLDFLKFSGEDLRSWLFKVEQFFNMENVPMDERVNVASVQFEGEAIQWHLAFMKYRQYLHPPTWSEYAMTLVERFGSDYDDPMEEIKKVRQTGSMKDYQAIFERHLTRVYLSEKNAINYYLGGLKNELNMEVKIANPRTLSQIYKSARMQKVYLEAIKQPVQNFNHNRRYDQRFQSKPPLLPNPTSNAVAPTSKGVSRRTLSPEEMNEKRSKGLCYFCNEKYVFGNKCTNLKQLYLIEVVEPEEVESEHEEEPANDNEERLELIRPLEHMEISVHALNGSLGFRTLRLLVTISLIRRL
ncbi:hypothetical protein FXO38_08796 [Capsicum annuum]|nr:hypothetical protein FXO38_08796 [Capsicum annuum]